MIGSGTEYLLGLLIQLLGTDQKYAVEDPGYPRVHRVLQNYGIRPELIAVDAEGLDVQSLSASGAQIVHVTPSHQFPTGVVMQADRREQLLAWAGAEPGTLYSGG